MARHDSIGWKLVLGIVLTTGIAAVWAAVTGWSVIMVQQFNVKPRLNQSVVIRKDGTPLIRSYTDYHDPAYTTLDGEPVTFDENDWLNGVSLCSETREDTFFVPQPWQRRIYPLTDGARPERFWYFVHDGRREGAGYFEGFDRKAKRRLGYIGTNGFVQTRPPRSAWFPVDGRQFPYGRTLVTAQYCRGSGEPYPTSFSADSWQEWTVFIRCHSRLMEIDLRQRTAKTILDDQGLTDIAYLFIPVEGEDGESENSGPYRYAVATRLTDRIVFLDRGGEEIKFCRIPERLRNVTFSTYLLPGEQLLFTTLKQHLDTGQTDVAVYWTDGKGSVLNERQVTLVGYKPPSGLGEVSWYASGLFPVPGLLIPAMIGLSPLAEMERGAADYRTGMRRALPKICPALLAVALTGAVLAFLAVRRQRQFGLGQQKTWAAFVFFFGVPGYLAYLCHRRWPVRAECPACHTPSPQDRESCIQCDSSFPTPAPKGIEILA